MITVTVSRGSRGRLALRALFADGAILGDGESEVGRRDEYLGVPYEEWGQHRGHTVQLVETATGGTALRRLATR